jgi:subtilisin family serine protease
MKMNWTAWLIALAILGNLSAQCAAGQRVIITFKSGTGVERREAALQALGAKPVTEILSNDTQRQFVAVVAESSMALDALPKDASIDKVEVDYKIRWIEAMPAFTAPSASLRDLGIDKFASKGRFERAALRGRMPWGIMRVKAPSAWDFTEASGVRVAIIDTGIDSSHSDLQGKVDGGYNAITDCERVDCWQDDNGHGTHVSGTVAANGRGLVGVAPKARLYGVKVLDAEGSGSLSDVIKGIIWAANNGMQVANMSLGSPMPSDTMQRALRYAKARGVIVVAAAGNSGGSVGFPGAYPETIAVAASDWNDNIASFSSRGDEVKFIAPGVSIVSSAMGGDYASFSGTSMACPHVAGLAALAVSQGWRGLDGPDGVLSALRKAAVPLASLTPQEQGFGMIDAGKLVRHDQVRMASLP